MIDTFDDAKDAFRAQVSLNGVAPSEISLRMLNVLEAAGFETWYVGGWVRDALLGHSGHDVDLCCAGSWQQSEAALRAAGITVLETGIRFGGITGVEAGERVEITSYRIDGAYVDGRHPTRISRAGSIEDDLSRRDLTVNAMAWHPTRGLIDLFDGCADLRGKIIRAVGVAHERFEEDALRMLRAVRFACTLGFRMDSETSAAIRSCAPLLAAIGPERIGTELDRILATGRAGEALARYPELMCIAVPELAAGCDFDQRSRYHDCDVYHHTARVLTAAGEVAFARAHEAAKAPLSASLMWAALLHDIAKPDTFTLDGHGNGHFFGHPELGARLARRIMVRLARPHEIIRDAELLIRYHDRPMLPERSDLLSAMGLFAGQGVDTARLMNELFDLKRADTLGKAPACFYYVREIERMREMVRELFANRDAYSLSTLALSGTDLIECGIRPGPRIGELLREALAATIAGEVPNEIEALLEYLRLIDAEREG